MIIIFTLISFILEYIFNYFFHNSIFMPLIILTTVISSQIYFKKSNPKYYLYCFIVGFLYDLIYTGNYFLSAGLFLLIGVLVSFINSNLSNNIFICIISLIVYILIYRCLSFFLFFLNGYGTFKLLFKVMYSSLILNIVYGIFLYYIFKFILKRFKVKGIY